MPNIGPLEIIIVLAIVLIIFGPKRLPELGRSLGKGMRGFKDSVTGKDEEDRPEELPHGTQRVDATSDRGAAPDEAEPGVGEDRPVTTQPGGPAKPAGDAS